MRFVIVGGDAAGMSAASRAKRIDPQLDVVVLEQTGDVSYSACGMPYNIADPQRDIEELVVRRAEVFRDKNGIDLRTGHRADRIDPTSMIVSGFDHTREEFEIAYDKLLIATGASAIRPDLPGFDLPGVMVLKSLEEGRRIKELLRSRRTRRVVIIGMGYVALEMAESLRTLELDVAMVKPRPVFLPWMPEELSRVVLDELHAEGVGTHAGQGVNAIEAAGGDDSRLRVLCDEETIEADMVLVAIGVTPNSAIAGEAGLDLSVGRSIMVDRRMRTSQPDIFAAGDCADAFHVVDGQRAWIPLALRANRAGWAAADNVCGRATEIEGIAGTAVFKVFGLEVARTGLNAKEARAAGFDPVEVVVKTRSRAHGHPGSTPIWNQMVGDRKSGRLLGMQMVGREGVAHRINAPAVALHNRMTVAQFSQCDLAYAPPFGPTWDPTLTTANQLLKKL